MIRTAGSPAMTPITITAQGGNEIQEERLRRMCEITWLGSCLYCDRASGRKETLPELQRMMDDARRGAFNVVPWPHSTVSHVASNISF